MGAAFLPLALAPPTLPAAVLAALLAAVAALAIGGAIVYPFEMDTVVALAQGRNVATHYGFYYTFSGLGVTLGNLGAGALWDQASRHDALWLVWAAMTVVGTGCALLVRGLARAGHLPSMAEREASPDPVAA